MRQLILVGLVGLVVGYGAFLLTAQAPQDLMNVGCIPAVDTGFDPLTGLPHGATIDCAHLTGAGGQIPVAQDIPMPAGLASRRAIPVPLGFVVGGALALIGLTVRRVRLGSEDAD